MPMQITTESEDTSSDVTSPEGTGSEDTIPGDSGSDEVSQTRYIFSVIGGRQYENQI